MIAIEKLKEVADSSLTACVAYRPNYLREGRQRQWPIEVSLEDGEVNLFNCEFVRFKLNQTKHTSSMTWSYE